MIVRQRPFLALGLRLCAGFGLASLYMLVKLVHDMGVSLPETMFWRQAVGLPLMAAWLVARGQTGMLRTQRIKAHATRSAMGMVGMVFVFGAQILLPLAVATILSFTTPMFAVLLSAIMLGEKVGPWRWTAVVLGFAGVIVIASPGTMHIPLLGAGVGLMAAFMVALISIQLRDMGRTEQPLAVVFYFALFGTGTLAPLLPFVMTHHTGGEWLAIIAMGAVGTAAQLLLTASLRYGAVASVVVMDYSTLVWTTLYGAALFHQSPPAHTWLGAPLVVAAGLVITWREAVKMRRITAVQAPETPA